MSLVCLYRCWIQSRTKGDGRSPAKARSRLAKAPYAYGTAAPNGSIASAGEKRDWLCHRSESQSPWRAAPVDHRLVSSKDALGWLKPFYLVMQVGLN